MLFRSCRLPLIVVRAPALRCLSLIVFIVLGVVRHHRVHEPFIRSRGGAGLESCHQLSLGVFLDSRWQPAPCRLRTGGAGDVVIVVDRGSVVAEKGCRRERDSRFLEQFALINISGGR